MRKAEILRARWISLASLTVVFGLYLFTSTTWSIWLLLLIAVVMAGVLTIAVEYWLRLFSGKNTELVDFREHDQKIGESRQDIEKITRHYDQFLQVHSEKDVIEVTMQAGLELLQAQGASFVPFDEWGQSFPGLSQGTVPETASLSWSQRLLLPETRQKCKNCETLNGKGNCVLLSSTKRVGVSVKCFPLKSSGREVGVVNFYFDGNTSHPNGQLDNFKSILDAAGKTLDNLHSRDQEIAALHYLQTVNSSSSELPLLLKNLLENIQLALEIDFVSLYLHSGLPGHLNQTPHYLLQVDGKRPRIDANLDLQFLEGLWKSVLASGHSLSLENVTLNNEEKWKSLLALPVVWQDEDPAGVLVLGSNMTQIFSKRHQALLETLAGQVAVLIQNARLMVQVEYQAVVDERTRLAREIHDGLAQTLAFLKIQAAQMQNFLARGETEKLTSTLQANYRTLSDAYIDARQAIDNLRRSPSADFRGWIGVVASDFEQASSQKVDLMIEDFPAEFPVIIQAQLIRIVQEALSNVRKHAEATSVSILGSKERDAYIIKIKDNGRGFSPLTDEPEGASHYGLQGMRERSESIGADFQITSQPGNGTCVSVRLPAALKEEI